MRWTESRHSFKHPRDDPVPDILRVENCSEVDVAGNFYKQDGKYYDDCCDLANEDAPECAEVRVWLVCLIAIIVWVCLALFCGWICPRFCDCVETCCSKCYNTCCARCELQPIVRNDNNATRYRTERSNISTISANIPQPPTPSSETMAQ